MTSAKVQDHNTFDNPENVVPDKYEEATLSGNKLIINMPPNSVIVLNLEK